MDNKKQLDDIPWLRKKIENLNSIVSSLKNNDQDGTKDRFNVDMTKYVENFTFQEFTKSFNLEIFGMNKRVEELKRMVDDIILTLKNKVTDKDLKNLESN